MKLIFNREIGSVKQGDIELNALLGFLDKSFDYEDIERFIKTLPKTLLTSLARLHMKLFRGIMLVQPRMRIS